MVTGVQFDRTFRSGEKFKQPDLEEQEMEYLYAEGNQFCFMNMNVYTEKNARFFSAPDIMLRKRIRIPNLCFEILQMQIDK
mgnify:CR=1 FL=1